MKKIGLLSDTHSFLDDNIFKYFENCDEIWHAGDVGDVSVLEKLEAFKPVVGVYGNIDDRSIRNKLPLNQRFFCEGIDVFMTHIGGYPGRYTKRVKDIIEQNPPYLYICGHSHILKIVPDKKNNVLHMNPGACGHHGFHQMRTIIRFDIADKKIENLDVIELGTRGTLKSK